MAGAAAEEEREKIVSWGQRNGSGARSMNFTSQVCLPIEHYYSLGAHVATTVSATAAAS